MLIKENVVYTLKATILAQSTIKLYKNICFDDPHVKFGYGSCALKNYVTKSHHVYNLKATILALSP